MSISPLLPVVDYRSLVDNFEAPVVLFDESLHVIYQNVQSIDILGRSVSHISQLVLVPESVSSEDLLRDIQREGSCACEMITQETLNNDEQYDLRVMLLPRSKNLRFVGVIERRDSPGESVVRNDSGLDELTSLPNRYTFFTTLNKRIDQVHKRSKFAVLYFDLDHFKDINELYGHNIGDELLRLCAVNINQLLSVNDHLARLSGDEYAALIECDNTDDVQRLCGRLLQMFERPLSLNGRQFQFTVSIGVAFYPENGCSPEELLIHAEKAMFVAKRRGRSQFQLFDQQHSQQVEHQQRLAEALRRELNSHPDQFYAVYQPLYSLQNGDCIGMEVLARWHSPEFGHVPPSDFIPLAESRGLVNILSQLLYEVVLKDLSYRDIDEPKISRKRRLLAINVSAQQILCPNFERLLLSFFKQISHLGWQLEIELTESQLMSQTDALIEKLSSWREMGIRIAIDDFGTGYSCLAYLHLLPIDKLKIDRQFLQAQTASRSEDQIMYAILAMANALNLDVLAEGVETGDQFQRLIELGCNEAQGFGLAKPQAWSPQLVTDLWDNQNSF